MMAGSGGDTPAADGGLARHIPVLGGRAVEFLNVRAGGVYLDATFGAGGYCARRSSHAADCSVIGIDRDQSAVAGGFDLVAQAERPAGRGRGSLLQSRSVARACGYDAVDGVVFDLGVSSMQLDEGARGFSFRLDGPLDMRMGGDGPSAADVVARASERDLAVDHRDVRRGAPRPRRRPRDRAGARRGADRAPPPRSPTSSGASCMRGPAPSIRRPAPSRRCASS